MLMPAMPVISSQSDLITVISPQSAGNGNTALEMEYFNECFSQLILNKIV